MSDELSQRVDIVAIIGRDVELRQVGHEFQGRCPFHKDDTPSFSVNPEKGVYLCFGCGRKGDVYDYLKEKEGLSFPEAKLRLAEIAGIDPASLPRPPAGGRVTSISEALTDKPRNVAYYGYTDGAGKLLYEIVRREWLEAGVRKKAFLQRYKERGANDWTWKRHPAPVLYRLHKIVEAEAVWLVEGEKDVHTLEAWGLVATTSAGGSNGRWLTSYTQALAGKKVYIIPDNDDAGRKYSQKAYDKLAATSTVVIVRVPGPEKSDVTDWKASGGTPEALQELARQAEAAAEGAKRNDVIGARKGPNEIAKDILAKHSFLADENGFLYEYNGRFWERATSRRLQKYAQRYDTEMHTNRRRRGEVADFIETFVQIPRIHWRQLESTEIALENGVFDVRTLTLRPHRKEDHLETVIPVAYEEQAVCPTWRQALQSYFGQDEDCGRKVLALQQFFGYLLLPHAKYKKALVLLGESDTGKSGALALAEALVGSENTCSVGVEDMDDPRKRVPIVGKMLNKLSELSSKSVIADGGFKTLISTEEALLFDPKFVPPYMYTPFAKHIVATNVLPAISDLSKATFNRLMIIRFNRVIPLAEQDRDFVGKLLAELPGILNWAIQGAMDLVEHGGQFVAIAESQRIIDDYRRSENEINAFLDEKADKDESAWITAADVRSKFRTWAGRNYSDKAIGQMMRAAGFPGVPYHGEASRRHSGLRWKDNL
jgi:putative DNA primase/helicase